jgi:hypothetical protein
MWRLDRESRVPLQSMIQTTCSAKIHCGCLTVLLIYDDACRVGASDIFWGVFAFVERASPEGVRFLFTK